VPSIGNKTKQQVRDRTCNAYFPSDVSVIWWGFKLSRGETSQLIQWLNYGPNGRALMLVWNDSLKLLSWTEAAGTWSWPIINAVR
jgi:hypothetical protein